MTNKERVLAAIAFEAVDKVPYAIRFTSQALQRIIDYTGNAHFFSTLNNAFVMKSIQKPAVPTGEPDCYVDEFGVIWKRSKEDDLGVPHHFLIPDEDALDSFVDAPVDKDYIDHVCRSILDEAGQERFSVVQFHSPLYERAWMMCGMENFFCYMIEDPEKVRAFLRKICDRSHAALDVVLKHDIDCVYFADDYGQQNGLIMGYPTWKNLLKPFLQELFDHVHQAGKYIDFHSCGDNREILDELAEMGVDIYNTFQPEIYTLGYAQNLYGKLAVHGGISVQRDLVHCTPDRIREIVKETADAFNHTGLIIAPTHALPGDIPPSNILAMIEAMEAL